jgi:hypothetical protein
MQMLVGLSEYQSDDILSLCDIPGVEGAVIGDLFCQKRMFSHGEWDIPRYCEALKKKGKKTILQTPMYMTPRYLPQWLDLVAYLNDHSLVDAVLVQDIGLLAALARKKTDTVLCWSQMGKGRGSQINGPFLQLILQLGVTAIQLDVPARGSAAAESGLEVWQVYGSLTYQTFWRECYSCDQLDQNPQQCGRLCGKPISITSGDLTLSVNGHILGEQLIYKPEAEHRWAFSQQYMVYAKDKAALKDVIV